MITIHYDFVDGSEVSYEEGKLLKDNFTTCCLSFFNQLDIEVKVIKKDSSFISNKQLNEHTDKEVREEHNLYKLLISGSLKFKKPILDTNVIPNGHACYNTDIDSNMKSCPYLEEIYVGGVKMAHCFYLGKSGALTDDNEMETLTKLFNCSEKDIKNKFPLDKLWSMVKCCKENLMSLK